VPLLLGRAFALQYPLRPAADARAQNTSEGVSFGYQGIKNASALVANYPHMAFASIARLVALYPDDALLGCLFGAGSALVPKGRVAKPALRVAGMNAHARKSEAGLYLSPTSVPLLRSPPNAPMFL
jgi:hypothetical protein